MEKDISLQHSQTVPQLPNTEKYFTALDVLLPLCTSTSLFL